jgi:hypothetical protein
MPWEMKGQGSISETTSCWLIMYYYHTIRNVTVSVSEQTQSAKQNIGSSTSPPSSLSDIVFIKAHRMGRRPSKFIAHLYWICLK